MIKTYKFEHNEDQKIFFTSDTHFRHNKDFVYSKRGYSCIDEHDESIINKWNKLVRPQDVVWHLGDHILGAGRDAANIFKNYFCQRLNGNIYTLWGNHTSGAKDVYKETVKDFLFGNENDLEIYPIKYKNVTFVGNSALCQINYNDSTNKKRKQLIFMSHYAHRIWYDMAKGVVALSGHSHGSDKESNPDHKYHKRVDIGIDNFGEPVIFDEVMRIMETKEVSYLDHHDHNTNPS